MGFDLNSAKALIESGMSEAQDMLRDPIRIDDLLISLEEALKLIPVAGETLADIPLTISLVKSYITKEYTEVSPKVVITLISAFIYIVKRKDLISDSIPFVGQVDDIAVLKLALTFVRPELDAYKEWRTAYRESKAVQNPNRSAEQAAAAEKAAATEPAASVEKATATEESATAQKAAATEESATAQKSAATEESATAQKPAATEESATAQKPAATENAASTEQAASAQKPAATEESTSAE